MVPRVTLKPSPDGSEARKRKRENGRPKICCSYYRTSILGQPRYCSCCSFLCVSRTTIAVPEGIYPGPPFSPPRYPVPHTNYSRERSRTFIFHLLSSKMEQHVSHLLHALPGKVALPEDQEYTASLKTYFSAQESQVKPACVVRPQNTADVVPYLVLPS